MRFFDSIVAFLQRPVVKSVLLWLVAAALAETFIKNGWRKFDPEGFWSNSFLNKWGFSLWFMYLIGVLEFVSGWLMLIPRTRAYASSVLALVMLGALVTRSIHAVAVGVPGGNLYGFFGDLLFFISTIAMLLFFVAYDRPERALGRST